MDMLFSAFEKHQYYNVKDLVRITKQPIVSIPAPICIHVSAVGRRKHINNLVTTASLTHTLSVSGSSVSATDESA